MFLQVRYLPLSVDLIPRALVMGMTMVGIGVFTPTGDGHEHHRLRRHSAARLLATDAPDFSGIGAPGRWLAEHVLTDGVFATCLDKLLREDDPLWRLGYYLAPAP